MARPIIAPGSRPTSMLANSRGTPGVRKKRRYREKSMTSSLTRPAAPPRQVMWERAQAKQKDGRLITCRPGVIRVR
jgi:hypothetical protein